MTVVNPKSISGINSITTGSGSDNLLTIHTSDASSTERVRINSSGDVIVGSGITVSPDGDIFATGVCTATTFSGSGASLTNLPAGNLTGTVADARISTLTASKLTGALPAISGANLTGITQTTINSNTNNYLITGTGTANTLQGEAKLTFDGDKLYVKNSSGNAGVDLNVSNNTNPRIDFNTANVGSSGIIKSEESGSGAIMEFHNKNSSGNEQQVMTLTIDRNVYVNDGNLVIGTSGHGIDFSATGGPTNGSGTSELFDDYEEGTWSPQIYYQNSTNQSNSTNNASYGWYTKIGNLVTVSLFLRWSLTGSPANDNNGIKNFPFVNSTVTSTYGNAGAVATISHAGTDLASDASIVFKWQNDNSTTGLFELPDSTSNLGNEMGANTGMRAWACFSYRTT